MACIAILKVNAAMLAFGEFPVKVVAVKLYNE